MVCDWISERRPSILQVQAVAERTETERLDWVVRHRPEFEEGYLIVYLTESSSPSGRSGYFTTKGKSVRDCIDQALNGHYISID